MSNGVKQLLLGLICFAIVNTAALTIVWHSPDNWWVGTPCLIVDLAVYGFILARIMWPGNGK